MTHTADNFGECLRDWRGKRGLSQLELALAANVSQRHVSFLESGRAGPSRSMVISLSEAMSVPLSQRNQLLNVAGFAPHYPETPLEDGKLGGVRSVLKLMLERHMPYPAVLIDRYWNMIDANASCQKIFGIDHSQGPMNILQLMASQPQITEMFENWPEVAHHFLVRLQTEYTASGRDPKLAKLIDELRSSPVFQHPAPEGGVTEPFIPARIRRGGKVLSLVSAIAQFGTPTDVTVSDLRIEFSLPADDETDKAIHEIIEATTVAVV
ncbi:MAG: helix-turn-helix transcriptional regulator [Pseudomonadota bacterium]